MADVPRRRDTSESPPCGCIRSGLILNTASFAFRYYSRHTVFRNRSKQCSPITTVKPMQVFSAMRTIPNRRSCPKRQFAGCGEIGLGKFAFVDSCCLSDSRILFFFIGIKSAHLQPEERLVIVLFNHDGQSAFLPFFPQRLKELTAEWRTWREKFLSDVYHILSLQSNPITWSRNAAMT